MEAERVPRVLWTAPRLGPDGFPPGPYRLTVEPDPEKAVRLVEQGRRTGDPFAVCCLCGAAVQAAAGGLAGVDPDLFLVIEGEAPGSDGSGEGPRPERRVVLASPAAPAVRRALAEHLCARWRQEEAERRRVSALEAEAENDRAERHGHERRLQMLYGLVEQLHGARSLEEALEVALGEMSRFLGARTGSLLLLDGPDRFRVAGAVGPRGDRIRGLGLAVEDSRVARYALEERQPILVRDFRDSDRFEDREIGVRYRPRSILSVPLLARDGPLGVLNFGGDDEDVAFDEDDRQLMVTLGRQVAVALEKARLLEGLRTAVSESIRALAGAIEAKDPYTRGHSERVTHYSRLVAEALGLGRGEIDVIVRAGVLHDVGKIGVPSAVLNKPGKLDDREYALIQRHPSVGVEIVREIRSMGETLEIIRTHHERVDGRGYPNGLSRDEIPLGARILAVADTFDAMTSDRPYRRGLSVRDALDEIERCAGTQFDPEIARAFVAGAPGWPDLAGDEDEPAAKAARAADAGCGLGAG